MLFDISHEGRTTLQVDREHALALGYPEAAVDAAEAAAQVDEKRLELREAIESNAGDVPSLLGTAADGAQLAIYGLASLVAKLATANSLAEVREAAAPFAAMSGDFLAKVESGDVKLPFMIKGTENVVADIETRATAVSQALIQASTQENNNA